MGCRKESYFLEFMYVDVVSDFVGVVFHLLLDGAKGSHNLQDCCCFEPPHSLNLDFKVFEFLVSLSVVVVVIIIIITITVLLLLLLSPG